MRQLDLSPVSEWAFKYTSCEMKEGVGETGLKERRVYICKHVGVILITVHTHSVTQSTQKEKANQLHEASCEGFIRTFIIDLSL